MVLSTHPDVKGELALNHQSNGSDIVGSSGTSVIPNERRCAKPEKNANHCQQQHEGLLSCGVFKCSAIGALSAEPGHYYARLV